MRLLAATLLAVLLLPACSNHPRKPARLLPDSTYVSLMVELQLLKMYNRQQHPDSTTVDSLRGAIFKKHGASERQFRNSHNYYQQQVDNQTERIKKAIEKLRKDHLVGQDTTAGADSLKTHR